MILLVKSVKATMRINDNSCVDKSQVLSQIPKIAKKLSNKTITQLENEGVFIFPECVKNSEDLSGEQMVLQSINDMYYTGNIMGFLGFGKERLTISSRFAQNDSDYFLQYMLDKVLDYPNIFDLETESDKNNQLINILMFLFPFYLKSAMRKGLFKKYINAKYNDANLKGNINIARHIKQNTPFIGKIAYDKREQSLDNYMLQLVRHTIEYIKHKHNGNQILARSKEEVKRIVEVTVGYRLQDRKRVLTDNKKYTIRHAYFREYRALQHLCILILQHQKQELGAGITRVYGVLFDGAWLWEEYIDTLVRKVFYHPKNRAHSDAQWLFSGERKIGLIYPDFIGKDSNDRTIADAKYKPFDNIAGQDYLQLLAYMLRFESKRGLYFYPESDGKADVRLWINKGSTYEKNVTRREDTFIIKHGLKIPDNAKNYNEFSLKMKAAESEFILMLSNL